MNPRVMYNETLDYLRLCPGDEEPEDFEEPCKPKRKRCKKEAMKTLAIAIESLNQAPPVEKYDQAYKWEQTIQYALKRRSKSLDVHHVRKV